MVDCLATKDQGSEIWEMVAKLGRSLLDHIGNSW
jgi:hypothetical protein